jgi:aryl-alcohol dehydrogenase-like predicted oxidoreductase
MNRIGLGCMGMARRNEESSIRTVDTALDHGVTMFNVAEFFSPKFGNFRGKRHKKNR